MRIRAFYALLLLLSVAAQAIAQLPGYYHTVNRVTWVVGNLDRVRPKWEAIGLTDIQVFTNMEVEGEYRGSPITITAWQMTGRLGNLMIDMIQPGEGQRNAYTDYLSKHGDGILSIVHEVTDAEAMAQEVRRLESKGVKVLQNVRYGSTQLTYFDTEKDGKFVLGLVDKPGGMDKAPAAPVLVSHFAAVVWDGAPVSAYWEKLGFPAFPMAHATPREDSRYKGNPLLLAFDVGFQRHAQFQVEWISPPAVPPNIYADFLKRRQREGFQHIGVLVDDLPKAVARYEALGYTQHQAGAWGDIGKPNSGQYVYMDTTSAGGVSVELVRRY